MAEVEVVVRKMGRIADSLKSEGEVLADRMAEVIPDILSGKEEFVGSEFEELLDIGSLPEKRRSIGWGVIEKVYRKRIKELFSECDNKDRKQELAEYIKKKYQYDPINNCIAGDSDDDHLNALKYALEKVGISEADYNKEHSKIWIINDNDGWCVTRQVGNTGIEIKPFDNAYNACIYMIENMPQLENEDSKLAIKEYHRYLNRLEAYYSRY